MNIAIRYFTRTGNTKKLADAIGEEFSITPQTTKVPIKEPTDMLFLGSSVYAAGVDSEVKGFIASLNPKEVKLVVCFGTAALLPSTYEQIKKLAAAQGIRVSDKEFHCRGSFAVMHRNRPNAKDLENAAKFAKDVLSTEGLVR